MSMHHTPELHEADPPAMWNVVKVAERCWHLDSSLGGTFGYYETRKAAEADRLSGPYVTMYEKDGRWFAGQTPAGWKPYSAIVAEREARAARQRAREAEALRQHLSTEPAHALYVDGFDLASMTRAELVQLHDDMPVTAGSCRDCPSNYR